MGEPHIESSLSNSHDAFASKCMHVVHSVGFRKPCWFWGGLPYSKETTHAILNIVMYAAMLWALSILAIGLS